MEEKLVDIEHEMYGVVRGVRKAWNTNDGHHWYRLCDGVKCIYFERKNWREIHKTKWVTVDHEIQRNGKTLVAWVNAPQDTYPRHFHLDDGYRWKTVEIEKEINQ